MREEVGTRLVVTRHSHARVWMASMAATRCYINSSTPQPIRAHGLLTSKMFNLHFETIFGANSVAAESIFSSSENENERLLTQQETLHSFT